MRPPPFAAASRIAAASASLERRATAIVSCPAALSAREIARPTPRLPPVTTILPMLTDQLARGCDLDRRHHPNDRRHLVWSEAPAARRQDVGYELLRARP